MSEPLDKPARRRAPSNFRQQDVARAIKAVKGSGLDIVRVEVEPKTAKITLVVRNDDNTESKVNPLTARRSLSRRDKDERKNHARRI
jgi:hypothetical protein